MRSALEIAFRTKMRQFCEQMQMLVAVERWEEGDQKSKGTFLGHSMFLEFMWWQNESAFKEEQLSQGGTSWSSYSGVFLTKDCWGWWQLVRFDSYVLIWYFCIEKVTIHLMSQRTFLHIDNRNVPNPNSYKNTSIFHSANFSFSSLPYFNFVTSTCPSTAATPSQLAGLAVPVSTIFLWKQFFCVMSVHCMYTDHDWRRR